MARIQKIALIVLLIFIGAAIMNYLASWGDMPAIEKLIDSYENDKKLMTSLGFMRNYRFEYSTDDYPHKDTMIIKLEYYGSLKCLSVNCTAAKNPDGDWIIVEKRRKPSRWQMSGLTTISFS